MGEKTRPRSREFEGNRDSVESLRRKHTNARNKRDVYDYPLGQARQGELRTSMLRARRVEGGAKGDRVATRTR